MSAVTVIAALTGAGVRLWAEGDRLRYNGPAEILTDAKLAELTLLKPAIMAVLIGGPLEHLTQTGFAYPAGYFGLYGVAVAELLELAYEAQNGQSPEVRACAAEAYWRLLATVPPPPVPIITRTLSHRQDRASEPPVWPADLAGLIAKLATIDDDAIIGSFVLRPGITVGGLGRFLAGLRSTVALGPTMPQARKGLLQRDLEDLFVALAAPRTPIAEVAPVPRPPALRAGQTPSESLTELGGYDGAAERFGMVIAHRMWDSARLYERDRDKATAERWIEQFKMIAQSGKEADR
jgi:hypothetical protein